MLFPLLAPHEDHWTTPKASLACPQDFSSSEGPEGNQEEAYDGATLNFAGRHIRTGEAVVLPERR
eukprot:8129553-Prorocentrum_lima.AAC.1